MECEDGESANDDLSDGYLSDSGSDVNEDDDDVTEETSGHSQPYIPPQLQPQSNRLKLRKSINGLINRYCVVTVDCGFEFPY